MANELYRIRIGLQYRAWPRGWGPYAKQQNKEALKETGLYWAEEIFPDRFTHSGARELRMVLRNPAYQKEKLEQGENLPLVGPKRSEHSGQTKRMTESFSRITSSTKTVTVRKKAPNYITSAKSKANLRMDMGEELKRVSPGHLRMMAEYHDENMTRRFNNIKESHSTMIQGS